MDDFTDARNTLRSAIESQLALQELYARYSEETSDPELKGLFIHLGDYRSMHHRSLETELKVLDYAENGINGRPSDWLWLLKEELSRNGASNGSAGNENGNIDLEQCQLTLSVAENLAKVLEGANQELLWKQIRYEQELAIAGDIQKKFLPQKLPQDIGLQVAASNIMARPVGGDYYDFITDQRGQISMMIADSMGKGIPAALLMTTVRAIWRSQSLAGSNSPGQGLETINRTVYSDLSATESFVTMLSALYDPASSIFQYSSAGHSPAIFYKSSVPEHKMLDIGGIPMGILPDSKFPSDKVVMREDDIIVMYTDGVVEAEYDNRLFGIERLCHIINHHRNSSAEEIKDAILSEVDSYTHGAPLADDTTVMVLKKI